MRPVAFPATIRMLRDLTTQPKEVLAEQVRRMYASRPHNDPLCSVVIPAYNEEQTILPTLYSLAATSTGKQYEIIVVDNNSTDTTASLVERTGIRCVPEKKQGITAARNAGLAAASGKYILNADADSLYPPDWIDAMTGPLTNDPGAALTYGRFAFAPIGNTSRLSYFFYEYLADGLRWINRKFREEAVNVYGFNSAFRREDGIAVKGFDHPPGTNEDGWLAVKLRDQLHGRLIQVTDSRAMVWTSDRRIASDGGLYKATWMRIKRTLLPPKEIVIRKDL